MANATSKPLPKGRPNYAAVYANPLPITTHPLPAFIPHNPLSILRLAYTIVSQFFFPPNSHPQIHTGYFDANTNSVHVTDHAAARALWEQGFFGKGSLSRSEPEWLEREKRRLASLDLAKGGGGTSGERTNKRRDERREQKRERARLEMEAVEEQLRLEGKLPPANGETRDVVNGPANLHAGEIEELGGSMAWNKAPTVERGEMRAQGDTTELINGLEPTTRSNIGQDIHGTSQPKGSQDFIVNQEHLQLTPVEAFFLVYALGAVVVFDRPTGKPIHTLPLLKLFRSVSYFPPADKLRPDDPFLVSYVVYHHFRSLGWVVRSGIKFACDYLLYARGPVFAHAEFAVLMMPSYTHPDWQTDHDRKDWYWLHCVNRVENQVRKSLVLAYVDIPPALDEEVEPSGEMDVGRLLKQYRVREYIFKRWSPNRNRD